MAYSPSLHGMPSAGIDSEQVWAKNQQKFVISFHLVSQEASVTELGIHACILKCLYPSIKCSLHFPIRWASSSLSNLLSAGCMLHTA